MNATPERCLLDPLKRSCKRCFSLAGRHRSRTHQTAFSRLEVAISRGLAGLGCLIALTWHMLSAGTCAGAQTTNVVAFNDINQTIPDHATTGFSISTNLNSAVGEITSVAVHLKVAGGFNGDLYAYLRHSSLNSTNICVLLNRSGRDGETPHGYGDSGMDVHFTSSADKDIHTYRLSESPAVGGSLTGTWQPDGRLTAPLEVTDLSARQTGLNGFVGGDGTGEWTFFIADMDAGVTSTLMELQIEIVGTEVAPPDPPQIIFARLDGQRFEISFPGVPHLRYDVEMSTTLAPANWQLWTNFIADKNGQIQLIGDFQPTAGSQFFRAVAR